MNLAVFVLLVLCTSLVWAVWKQEGRIRKLEEARKEAEQRALFKRAFGPTPDPVHRERTRP